MTAETKACRRAVLANLRARHAGRKEVETVPGSPAGVDRGRRDPGAILPLPYRHSNEPVAANGQV